MTLRQFKARERRKLLRDTETRLHPYPRINGMEIVHEHLKDGRIRFTAWKGDRPANERAVIRPKQDVLDEVTHDAFYQEYKEDWEFVTEETKNAR